MIESTSSAYVVSARQPQRLPAFARAILQDHVQALAVENLRMARALEVPLLKVVAHLSESELMAMQVAGLETLLQAWIDGVALAQYDETLRLWEADQLPGIPRDSVEPEDMALAGTAQKIALLGFIPRVSRSVEEAIALAVEIEEYYAATQKAAMRVYTRLREDAARAVAEREAALAQAEELAAANEELAAANEELQCQQEELQAQQEELESLNEQLREHSAHVEAEVARRTAELQEANLRLEEADRYKDEFLGVISHEMRTPLNFISSFASVLDDEVAGPLSPVQHEYLGKILTGADRMLLLVNNLLDMSRMQAGKFDLSPEATAVAAVVDEVVETLQPLAAQKNVALSATIDVEAPVVLDRVRIVQVLTNLVDNAIKFTPGAGRVTVSARLVGTTLRCEVADSGIGISSEDQAKLFQRFTQLDMGMTRRAGGTGLGLSISKGLVEAHGGIIGVASTEGAGSTFWFELPQG